MECEPAANEEMTRVDCPTFRVPLPRLVLPSKKVTVPVGVPAVGADGLTVAVSVMAWPKIPGLGEALTEIVVAP